MDSQTGAKVDAGSRAGIIDGKAFAAGVRADVARHVARLKSDHGIVKFIKAVGVTKGSVLNNTLEAFDYRRR